ncbi:hypothetical protein BX600DRAFT_505799 [Xylariales sp. PMI_506]|nr:hypothetical protein BX600DRAFT_505799 [Xylariales sp. PMI_506]
MQLTRRGMPSQRYSPDGDYTYDHHEVIQNSRRPLGESTGNAQPHSLGTLALCHQGQLTLSPPLHSIPTPPIVPTQAITSTYGTSLRNQHSFHRDVSLRDTPMAHSRGARNPIYSWKHFADYRAKVTQKESENEDPTWPLYLEDAFLDALLLIPLMGRKKFSSKGVLYGRNMLITEYLWICHWLLYPPGPGEMIPVGKIREKHPMYRGRKQVSSHIQVLKGFFLTHPLFHFFFPRKNDEKEDERRSLKEEEGEMESFKNNRVLIALAEGRLPDERPNYDYFARLLAGDSEVFVRPKTCWIYVSSTEVTLSNDCKKAYASDGSCLEADGYSQDGVLMECKGDYPHLILNSNKETRRDLGHGKDDGPPKYLLHEYTRTLSQKESSSIKEISSKWDHRFPDLREKLLTALDDVHPSHERTSRCVVGPCDTIQFEVVLDLHATSQFPSGTHLDGVVQLQICRPELANHRWRSVTSIVKPRELDLDNEAPFWNCSNPCEVPRRGNRSDTIEVPFPAKSWANTFIRLARYVTAERERRERGGSSRLGRETSKLKREDGEDDSHKQSNKSYTPKELLQQIAMYQEIWSAPNDGSDKPCWTRRAVILWTFSNVHSKVDDKGKVVTVPPGTNWRFLTKIDPTSQFHQQRAYVSGSPRVSRDSLMSPNPGYSHHLSAAMHENFTSSYDAPNISLPGQQHAHLAALNLLDGFSHGLATPPPTASLSSSYAHSFDSAASNESMQQNVSFLSDNSGTDSQSTMVPDHADPFLAGLGVPVSTYEDSSCEANLQAWANAASGNMQGLDSVSQWATTYVDSQQSMAWADNTGLASNTHGASGSSGLADPNQWHDPTSRANTPWHDGKNSLWATSAATGNSATSGTKSTSHQHGHDAWNAAASQPWLQPVAGTTDTNGGNNSAVRGSWAPHQLGSSQAASSNPAAPSQVQGPPDHGAASVYMSGAGGGCATSLNDFATSPMRSSRKRPRGDDEDEDEDRENLYPRHHMRKLTHSSNGRGNAPQALMMESDDGVHPQPFL